MLFLVSHANETDDQSYIIKHVYLHAKSLLHAHVYVTLFGYKISPEFYQSEEEDFVSPTEDDFNRYLNHTIEYFEESNRSCSVGEHYWHSIKEISNLNNQYPLQLNQNEQQSKFLFKLTIQTNYSCSKHLIENLTYYDIEQNTNIYQFQAESINNVIQYIFTHVQDYQGLIEFCQQIGQTPEKLANIDWQTIALLCKTNLEQCTHSLENCQKQHKINLNCEEISQSIPVFHSEI
jgi:hypothetical protein